MLEKFFSAPKTLQRLRSGISGAHLDAFADDLEREGYALASAVRYIRGAAHLGCFVHRKGSALAEIDSNTLESFNRHLRRCRCPYFKRGSISYHAQFGVRLFHRHLIGCGVCSIEPAQNLIPTPALVSTFCDWYRTHRGVKEPTLRQYARGAADLLRTLGENVAEWNGISRSGVSSGTFQPVRDPDNTGADHFAPGVSPFPLLPGRIPPRSRPRDTCRGTLASREIASLFIGRRTSPIDRCS